MSWLSESDLEKLRALALSLTKEERQSLTWREARKFVAPDTLEMAKWQGILNSIEADDSPVTPWQAVCHMRGIK